MRRAPNTPIGFTRQVCSTAAGQATYCSTVPAALPACRGSSEGGQTLHTSGSSSSVFAGGLAAVAGGVLVVAAASAAVGMQRRRLQRRQHRAAQVPSNWDRELGCLLTQAPAAGHQQQYSGPTELLVGSSSPCTSSGRSSRSGGAAGSRDGSRERLGTHSSWRLRSRSLQLKADDFQILLDKAGRPDLLGAGATAKVSLSRG